MIKIACELKLIVVHFILRQLHVPDAHMCTCVDFNTVFFSFFFLFLIFLIFFIFLFFYFYFLTVLFSMLLQILCNSYPTITFSILHQYQF